MDRRMQERFAEVVLGSGLDLAPGQPLLVRADIANRDFALVLAGKAYSMGCAYVHTVYTDSSADTARIRLSEEGSLSYVPSFLRTGYRAYVDENWASVSISGPEDPDAYETVDPRRTGIVRKAVSAASREWLEAISANRIRWNVCPHPTDGWARKVLGPGASAGDLWRVLVPILRLDREDPAAAWLEHDAELKRRAGILNRARFDAFRITGPGTDLLVGMAPDRVFVGGRGTAKDGRMFFPNIPTEEVFGTPDFRRTRGRAVCTRPVQVNGSNVEGAWFEFEDGRVVSCGAERNEAALAQFLETDGQARFLGELALVGTDSPIAGSGLVFNNILLDENAAIHIALGNGYTECVEGATGLDDSGLLERGCNVSLVHVDFMIGSDEVSVDGLDSAGNATRLLERGRFVV